MKERSPQAEWLDELPAEAGRWVLANLFLHHFSAERLRALLKTLAEKTVLLCACEPRRDGCGSSGIGRPLRMALAGLVYSDPLIAAT
jgi:hypothetical protein